MVCEIADGYAELYFTTKPGIYIWFVAKLADRITIRKCHEANKTSFIISSKSTISVVFDPLREKPSEIILLQCFAELLRIIDKADGSIY